ncbi:LemA family protein [Candidatus Gottesmanbacteria bacterium]|nr:LemA family protein [Candidatus Gottesmanbacteria bacterium]
MNIYLIVGGVVLLILLYVWSLYNGLVQESTEIDEASAQIDVQLKRRADLIPNLVNTVKGYAKHEKGVFTEVTRARSALIGAKSLPAKAKADGMLSDALKSLFAVAEAYPQLRANENFTQLQKELSDTEDKVAYARQYYNTQLLEFNLKVKTFPNVLLASHLGFRERQFFEATANEKKNVSVKFE